MIEAPRDRDRPRPPRSFPAAASHRRAAGNCPEAGSVLMLVLFACLAAAVAIQALSTVVLCAERAVVDESSGRSFTAERDEALAAARMKALAKWAPAPWAIVASEPHTVEARITALPEGGEWVMEATARHGEAVSPLITSAWLENGRDGLDLPLAALVAGDLSVAEGRSAPWLGVDRADTSGGSGSGSDPCAVGYLQTMPPDPKVGEACLLERLDDPWRLDPGWRNLGAGQAFGRDDEGDAASAWSAEMGAVAPEAGTVLVSGRRGQSVVFPSELDGSTSDSPFLVVVTGGSNLDARGKGDVYGVVVVDDGDLMLEGTTVHGAVFATGTIRLGETGAVMFFRPILRWATDRSLVRVRLVPGTRKEGME